MFRKTLAAGLALLGLVWLTGHAYAQETYNESGSSKTTNTTIVRTTGTTVVTTLDSHLADIGGSFVPSGGAVTVSRAGYGTTGKAAAMNPHGFGLWVNGGYSNIDFSGTMGGAAFAYSGDITNGMIGVDYKLSDYVTVGVAGGYENASIDTNFNAGTLDTDGYSVLPYVVLRLGRHFSVNASGGYSWLNSDVTRSSGAVTGNYDSKRWMGAVNLLSNWSSGKWRFGTLLGYLYIHQDDDAYTETGPGGAAVTSATTKIGQGRVGGQIGYDLGKVVTYFKGRYEYDFTSEGPALAPGTPTAGRSGFRLGVGMNFALAPNVSGNIEGTTVQGRDHLDEYGVNGTIRFTF